MLKIIKSFYSVNLSVICYLSLTSYLTTVINRWLNLHPFRWHGPWHGMCFGPGKQSRHTLKSWEADDTTPLSAVGGVLTVVLLVLHPSLGLQSPVWSHLCRPITMLNLVGSAGVTGAEGQWIDFMPNLHSSQFGSPNGKIKPMLTHSTIPVKERSCHFYSKKAYAQDVVSNTF